MFKAFWWLFEQVGTCTCPLARRLLQVGVALWQKRVMASILHATISGVAI